MAGEERRDSKLAYTGPDDAYELHRRGTRQLLVARACFFASSYVVSAILARQLGPAQYGIYGVLISQLLWLEMVVNAGVPGATAKLIADGRYDARRVEGSARALLLGLSLLMVAACWILAPSLASLLQIPEHTWVFRLAVLDVPLAAAYASYEGTLYGHRRFVVLAVSQAALGMLRVAGILTLVSLGLSVENVILVIILSTLAVVAGVAFYCQSGGIRAVGAIVRELLGLAAPMAVYLMFGQVLVNIDLWSLKSLWQGADEIVGQYVASGNLARTLSVIPAVQAGVVFASVAWAVAESDRVRAQRHVQEATRFAVILVAAAFVLLGANGSEILTTLFSGAYAGGDRFLRLQLAGLGLFALLDVFASSLMAAGRQRLVAAAVAAVVPVSWLANVLLIPRFGPIGAAISMVCGLALATTMTGVMAQRCFGSVLRPAMLARVMLAALVVEFASAAWHVRGPVILLKVAILSVIYLLILLLLRELTWRDFRLHARKPAHSSS